MPLSEFAIWQESIERRLRDLEAQARGLQEDGELDILDELGGRS